VCRPCVECCAFLLCPIMPLINPDYANSASALAAGGHWAEQVNNLETVAAPPNPSRARRKDLACRGVSLGCGQARPNASGAPSGIPRLKPCADTSTSGLGWAVEGRRISNSPAHGFPPSASADFSPRMATYSAGRDVPANLISEPSSGTNLDITATDQIRPIATTAIPIHARICIPSASR
jgi:hypothetical protein